MSFFSTSSYASVCGHFLSLLFFQKEKEKVSRKDEENEDASKQKDPLRPFLTQYTLPLTYEQAVKVRDAWYENTFNIDSYSHPPPCQSRVRFLLA